LILLTKNWPLDDYDADGGNGGDKYDGDDGKYGELMDR
jgi:hypothetical protein